MSKGHTKRIHFFDSLQKITVQNVDIVHIDTAFCNLDPILYLLGRPFLSPISSRVVLDTLLISKQIVLYGYEFLVEELAIKFNTKIKTSLFQ